MSEGESENDKIVNQEGPKQIVEFQSLPLREYYDISLTSVLQAGLKELGRKRPENPI